jgi:hypothetical protein
MHSKEFAGKQGRHQIFDPYHFTIQIWTDFHKNEAKKKKNHENQSKFVW